MGAGIGLALGLGGAVLQGIGAAKATNAQAAQMYAEAGRVVAQGAASALDLSNEAALHQRQGRLLRVSGAYDAARATEKGEQLIAAQEAGSVSNGFQLKGSIADMIKNTGASAGLDIATMRYSSKQGVKNEEILNKVYLAKSVTTLHLAGAEALDMVSGANKIAGSATLAFIAPIIGAGGTALKSSFA